MAVYVTSDAHGHVRALDAALNAASIGVDDELFVLGDMVDRGPDPVGVPSLVRALPNARVLRGNHEELMLMAIARSGAPRDGSFDVSHLDVDGFVDWSGWMQNGGGVTATQLEDLAPQDFASLAAWVADLPLYAVTVAGGRTYALVHAGINPEVTAAWRADNPDADVSDPEVLEQLLEAQDPEDLLWVREGFWGAPTGLVDAGGKGPIVIAGHTPSPYLEQWIDAPDVEGIVCDDGLGKVVPMGACAATGGVPDRFDIDCAAAGGAGMGRVGVMRLDDHKIWYAEIEEGE